MVTWAPDIILGPFCCRIKDPAWSSLTAQAWTSPWPQVAAHATHIRLFLTIPMSPCLPLFIVPKQFCFCLSFFSPFFHHILDHHSGSCPAHMAMGNGGGLSSVYTRCATAISLAFFFCFICLFLVFFYVKKVSLYDLDWLGNRQTRMILRCSCRLWILIGLDLYTQYYDCIGF